MSESVDWKARCLAAEQQVAALQHQLKAFEQSERVKSAEDLKHSNEFYHRQAVDTSNYLRGKSDAEMFAAQEVSLIFGSPALPPIVPLKDSLEALQAHVDTLTTALQQQTAWQPIETAPRAGEIVVWGFAYGGWRPVVAHWMSEAPEDHPPIDSGWYHWTPGMQWGNSEQRFVEGGSFQMLAKAPTHWMLAPAPTHEEPRK